MGLIALAHFTASPAKGLLITIGLAAFWIIAARRAARCRSCGRSWCRSCGGPR